VDYLSQGYLAALHIRDLLDDAEVWRARNVHGPDRQTMSTTRQMFATRVYYRLRRHLGALLIQAGRRLAGCDSSPAYQAYGGMHR
jgi:hypothetical protein